MSLKNRIERFYFACAAKYYNDSFEDVIFSDESTVQLGSNSHCRWFKYFELNNTRNNRTERFHNRINVIFNK